MGTTASTVRASTVRASTVPSTAVDSRPMPAGHADRRRQPQPGRRGQPLHVIEPVPFENGARAEKTHAWGDALDDPAQVVDRHVGLL